jgi:hypothetical protein
VPPLIVIPPGFVLLTLDRLILLDAAAAELETLANVNPLPPTVTLDKLSAVPVVVEI